MATTRLRARLVLPLREPPIDDGIIVIDGGRIVSVGPRRASFGGPVEDLGDIVILPGLVNAHCHLDYTAMVGLPPTKRFVDWIQSLVSLKAASGYADYAKAWLGGAAMLVESGTTTVADIEAVPELLPEVSSATPLRVRSFLEVIGLKKGMAASAILKEPAARVEALCRAGTAAGLSPHALYSTTPELMAEGARLARARGWRLTTHLAESREESEMFREAKGPLFEWLKNQREMSDCGGRTPVAQAARLGLLGPDFLAVHANYLEAADIQLLAASGSSVVHCPRSHDYFQHEAFPYDELVKSKLNVCMGTDSLASTRRDSRRPLELNMFAEMQQFARAHPEVAPQDIVKMATVNGAAALGETGKIGELSPGAKADLIGIPYDGKARDVWEAIVHDPGHVSISMIDGRWAIAPKTKTSKAIL